MIYLTFRFRDKFLKAKTLLEEQGVAFDYEESKAAWLPNLIYFFETGRNTDLQREAIKQAKNLEREDLNQRRHHHLESLAEPL